MVEDSSTKVVKLPSFSGVREDYHMWWTRFCAYGMYYRFAECLTKAIEADMPVMERESQADTEEEKAARKRNKLAMFSFTLAFQTEALMALIHKSSTGNWPGGLAHKVVTALLKKYMPDDLMTHVELRTMMGQVRISNKRADPSELFEKISTISNRFRSTTATIDEAELIAIIMQQAPDEYKAVITTEQRLHQRSGAAMTLDELEEAMFQYWRLQYGTKDKTASGQDNKEISMIMCFKCHEEGHIAKFCPQKRKNGGNNGGNNGGGNGNGNGGGETNGNGSTGRKDDRECSHCGKKGHLDATCWDKHPEKKPDWLKKKQAKKKGEISNPQIDQSSGTGHEIMFCQVTGQAFPDNMALLNDPNIFICDSAATVDSTPNTYGLMDFTTYESATGSICGDGGMAFASGEGTLRATVCDNRGASKAVVKISGMRHMPKSPFNVLSSTKRTEAGWKLSGTDKYMMLEKDGHKMIFDIKIHTDEGCVFAIYLNRMPTATADPKKGKEVLFAELKKSKSMNIRQAHDKFGHMSEELTRKAAKEAGYVLTRGTLGPCEACTIGKAKQKNLGHPTTDKDGSDTIHLDCSTIKEESTGKKPTKSTWRLMVKAVTGLKISDFYKSKNAMVEPTVEKLHRMKEAGRMPATLRMDNAGENKLLEKRAESKDWKLGLHYEYTARNTPQANSLAEVGFTTITGRATSMLARANVPASKRHAFFGKAAKMATQLDGLVPIEVNGVTATRYVHDAGHNPAFANHLRTFGEAGTVTLKDKMHPKGKDKGVVCMLVGYADSHAGDCYTMWDPKTNRHHDSRDVIWLRRMFFDRQDPVTVIEVGEGGVPEEDIPEVATVASDMDSDADSADTSEEAEDEVVPMTELTTAADKEMRVSRHSNSVTTRSGRRSQFRSTRFDEMAFLQIDDEDCLNTLRAEREYLDITNGEYSVGIDAPWWNEICCVGAGIGGGFTDTQELHVMKYDEAMDTPDQDKWSEAVRKEHRNMEDHTVFKVVPIDDVPIGATVLSSTWAMKKKANGTYKARINARGFEQIDGEHYDEDDKAAPVVNDITIRILFTLIVMAAWAAEVLDVRGAFLHGMFKAHHKMYMKVPQGFEEFYPDNVVLLLLKTLYGTKQAALQFWRVLLAAFVDMSYERSKADACLYFQWTKQGLILWISWVDDCLVCGSAKGVKLAKEGMMKQFDCDEIGPLTEYVGCKVERNMDERWIKLTQPVLLQSYHDEFPLPEEAPPKLPAKAGDILVKGSPEESVSPEEQTMYRSGVGKLLHMMRWSRPDVLNRVRELSRFMSGATEGHSKALMELLSYCWSTPNRGLLLKPNEVWDGSPDFLFTVSGMSDSNYGVDPDTRRSISGNSTFLCGAPVATRSKQQGCVTLSVTEAELVAGVENVQDMLFVMSVLESIGLKVKKPMVLTLDNKGAVDLANNWTAAGRTRHIATRVCYLRELKEQGLLHVIWRPNYEMSSDIFTKNVGGSDFHRHVETYCGKDEYGNVNG